MQAEWEDKYKPAKSKAGALLLQKAAEPAAKAAEPAAASVPAGSGPTAS